jgi:hypothetical protein
LISEYSIAPMPIPISTILITQVTELTPKLMIMSAVMVTPIITSHILTLMSTR